MMTEKFEKELNKFFAWAEEAEYVIEDKAWTKKLVKDFEEPGRNKLMAFVKKVYEKNSIEKDSEEVEQKELLKEYKKWQESKKVKRAPSKAKVTKIEVDNELDTEETVCIGEDSDGELGLTTKQLVEKLGEPIKNEEDDDWTWEWKLKIEGRVYSVYDWYREGSIGLTDEVTWYMAGEENNEKHFKKDKKELEKYVTEKVEKKSNKKKAEVESETEEKPKKKLSKKKAESEVESEEEEKPKKKSSKKVEQKSKKVESDVESEKKKLVDSDVGSEVGNPKSKSESIISPKEDILSDIDLDDIM